MRTLAVYGEEDGTWLAHAHSDFLASTNGNVHVCSQRERNIAESIIKAAGRDAIENLTVGSDCYDARDDAAQRVLENNRKTVQACDL